LFSGTCSDNWPNLPKAPSAADPTAAGTLIKLEQSSLHEPEKKEVPVPTAAGTLGKLEQSSLHEPENKEVSVPTADGALGKLCQSSHLFVFWFMQ
jgi:hypothetical protein